MSALARNNVHVSGPAGARALVLAHGFGCDQNLWRLVAPDLARDHRVVLFDHVGAGGADPSAWDPRRYTSLVPYAEDVLEILAELDVGDAVFVGHSVSAMIGVLAANRDPGRIGALVLVGPSPRYLDDDATGYVGGFGPEEIEELLDLLDSNHLGWSAALAPVIMGNAERPELAEELRASFCRTDPEVARQFARVTFLGDNRADLDRVAVPTLVLQCADDAIAPTVVGRYVHEHVAGSRLVLMEARGHCPNLSAPAETIAAIRSFTGTGAP